MHLVEFDAAGQEMRFMAELSRDAAMLHIFSQRAPLDDAHSFTGSKIAGLTFEEFLQRKAAGDQEVTGPRGLRYQGKFINLSSQYRTGPKTIRLKARVDYDMVVSLETAVFWLGSYHSAYPGVMEYWDRAIRTAYEMGYAETLAGRRFYLTDWNKGRKARWATESTAINDPIQGSGGDQKYLAISTMRKRHPQFRFAMDLHDGVFFHLSEDHADPEGMILEAQNTLNHLPYADAWGWEPTIPFPWDAAYGPDWGHMKEIKP